MTAEIICCSATVLSVVLLFWAWGVRADVRETHAQIGRLARDVSNKVDTMDGFTRTVQAQTSIIERIAAPLSKPAKVRR